MRPSNRAADTLRPVSLQRNVARYAEGSCLVRWGKTWHKDIAEAVAGLADLVEIAARLEQTLPALPVFGLDELDRLLPEGAAVVAFPSLPLAGEAHAARLGEYALFHETWSRQLDDYLGHLDELLCDLHAVVFSYGDSAFRNNRQGEEGRANLARLQNKLYDHVSYLKSARCWLAVRVKELAADARPPDSKETR